MPQCKRPAFSVLLAACCAVILSWAAPAHATPGQIHEVQRPEVNLRAGPDTGAKVIGKLERGARVMEFARKGRWVRVKQMGRVGPEGWVHGALIAPEKLPEPPEPEAPAPPADEPGAAGSTGNDGGPRYSDDPGAAIGLGVQDRAFVPWGVTIKRKHRGRKGKGRHGRGGKGRKADVKIRPVAPSGRNLGWPRPSGAPNIGTF